MSERLLGEAVLEGGIPVGVGVLATHLVVLPVADVGGAVHPAVDALALPAAALELALVGVPV